MNLDNVIEQAEIELKEEEFRQAVEVYKVKLRRKQKESLLSKLFPYKIVFIRRDKL